MKMKTKNTLIPDRSQPGITMPAPTVRHWDVGDKYATGVPKIKKIRGRENIFIGLSDEGMDMDTMITTYNTAVTDAASEILGKERRRKKPWVTKDVLDLCDERRDLKKKRYEAE